MRILIFFIFSIVFIFGANINQIPTDTPKDQVISIKSDKGTYCYSPKFTKGNGYVLLSDCKSAIKARYDVFQRVSWKVNGSWMCLTAPPSITSINSKSSESWDWLLVEPCVLNDTNQKWIVKDNSFYTFDGRFKIKDYKWYAFISKNPKDYNDHALNMPDMQNWLDTIATPGNISLKFFIGWDYISTYPPVFKFYYLHNNKSSDDDIYRLYYNPENGHIADFDSYYGVLNCLTSNQSSNENWDWVSWNKCGDDVPKDKDSKYWEFFDLNSNEGTLRDQNGNFLRITQFGSNWGVPYTVKPSYLEKDTKSSPKSFFVFDKNISRWDRYVNSNLGDSLPFCPAPGKSNSILESKDVKNRSIRSLPPSFRITEEWIRRFWQIATTTQPDSPSHISYCGICLLQSYQLLAELREYYIRGPILGGGFFFDTAENTDPFISFRSRFSLLAQRLEGTLNYGDLPFRANEDITTRVSRIYYAMALIMLPRYTLTPSTYESDQRGISSIIDTMLRSPNGTLWIAHTLRRNGENTSAHAQPVLRAPNGLVFIPTNTPGATYENYRSFLMTRSVATNIQQALDILSSGDLRVSELMVLRVDGEQQNNMNFFLSNNNCTGEGADRRGNGRYPSSSSLNQCISKRCAIQ